MAQGKFFSYPHKTTQYEIRRNQKQIDQSEEDDHAPTLQQILDNMWEL